MSAKQSGRSLNETLGLGAQHALYREDGKWYHRLTRFPGVLFDANGYVIFRTAADYTGCIQLQIKEHVHVPEGISAIPGYVQMSAQRAVQPLAQQIQSVAKKCRAKGGPGKRRPKKFRVPSPPQATDMSQRALPKRAQGRVNRIIRDTKLALYIKFVHEYQCQICGLAIPLRNGDLYAESHHIKPLGEPHNGPDIAENIICACPNHHAQSSYLTLLQPRRPDTSLSRLAGRFSAAF